MTGTLWIILGIILVAGLIYGGAKALKQVGPPKDYKKPRQHEDGHSCNHDHDEDGGCGGHHKDDKGEDDRPDNGPDL